MNKWKSKSFYIVLISAIIMVLQSFGLEIDVPYVSEIVYALCALGVVLGIIVDDGKDTGIKSVEDQLQKPEFPAFDIPAHKDVETEDAETVETDETTATTSHLDRSGEISIDANDKTDDHPIDKTDGNTVTTKTTNNTKNQN